MSGDSAGHWAVEPALFTRCRLCYAVVAPQLGWLYYQELTHAEIRNLCEVHWEHIRRSYEDHGE